MDSPKVEISLPSLRDDSNGYRFLFRLLQQVREQPRLSYDIDFKKCSIIDQNGLVLLGATARLIDTLSRSKKGIIGRIAFPTGGIMFKVDTMNGLIKKSLIENNFLSHFTQENFNGYPVGDYIGYREHLEFLDPNEIADHLSRQWLSDEKLSISEKLKSEIVSRIFEVFMNAYGHGSQQDGSSWLGVISCGQYDKKAKQLKLSVVDLGPGIISNVKGYHDTIIDDRFAMEWALLPGNSTRTDSIEDIPRGLGFGLLAEFTAINKGELKIYSNTYCAIVNEQGEYTVEKMKTPFRGTMVSITINCDDRHYAFLSEISSSKGYF